MINYQSEILIFETSGLICPDNNICMYGINQAVFTVLIWGPEKASHTPPQSCPTIRGRGVWGRGRCSRGTIPQENQRKPGFPLSQCIYFKQSVALLSCGRRRGRQQRASSRHCVGRGAPKGPRGDSGSLTHQTRAPGTRASHTRPHHPHTHVCHTCHILHVHTCTPYTRHTHTRTHTHACTHHTTHTRAHGTHANARAHAYTSRVCAQTPYTRRTRAHTPRACTRVYTHTTHTPSTYTYIHTHHVHMPHTHHTSHTYAHASHARTPHLRVCMPHTCMYTDHMHMPHTDTCAPHMCTHTYTHICTHTHTHTDKDVDNRYLVLSKYCFELLTTFVFFITNENRK